MTSHMATPLAKLHDNQTIGVRRFGPLLTTAEVA